MVLTKLPYPLVVWPYAMRAAYVGMSYVRKILYTESVQEWLRNAVYILRDHMQIVRQETHRFYF